MSMCFLPVGNSVRHRLPFNATPYCILFVPDARTQLDAITPKMDNAEFRGGLDAFVSDKKQLFRELQQVLEKHVEDKDRGRRSHNARIGRYSPGVQFKIGDGVIVREADSTLSREGIHPKLAHEHWTGPWVVTKVLQPDLSFTVRMNGRKIRQRTISEANVKPFYLRPIHLRHDFEDEFSHLP